MKIRGVIINEQGVTFAVVVVKKNIIDNMRQKNGG